MQKLSPWDIWVIVRGTIFMALQDHDASILDLDTLWIEDRLQYDLGGC